MRQQAFGRERPSQTQPSPANQSPHEFTTLVHAMAPINSGGGDFLVVNQSAA
jgi:hypothetical protein